MGIRLPAHLHFSLQFSFCLCKFFLQFCDQFVQPFVFSLLAFNFGFSLV